jgi:tryptophanyl-tRNA synthetase
MIMTDFGVITYDDELCSFTRDSPYGHFFDKKSKVIRSSRDLDRFLEHYQEHGNESCYIYTGRGPSSADMHLGHMVPFMVTRELQRCLRVRVVIQLTDDEKFLFRGEYTLEQYTEFARHNKQLILKAGLNPDLTDIYIDTEDIARFYPTMLKIQNRINFSQIHAVFGLESSDSIGKIAFPALEMAPCDPRCLYLEAKDMRCLVVCAWDQDPFFRLIRDHAQTLKFNKPSLLHLHYLPALDGQEKMSTTGSVSNYSIWLSDTTDQIRNKIKRHGFSGGGSTQELQREYGANIEVDVCCIYLGFFMQDRARYEQLLESYQSGHIGTKDIKEVTATVIDEIISPYR